jgi:hypothetical protein
MHWQRACIKSSNRTAMRFNKQLNACVYRHLDGDAYYFNHSGELKWLHLSKVEGYNDWEPDSPFPALPDKEEQDANQHSNKR